MSQLPYGCLHTLLEDPTEIWPWRNYESSLLSGVWVSSEIISTSLYDMSQHHNLKINCRRGRQKQSFWWGCAESWNIKWGVCSRFWRYCNCVQHPWDQGGAEQDEGSEDHDDPGLLQDCHQGGGCSGLFGWPQVIKTIFFISPLYNTLLGTKKRSPLNNTGGCLSSMERWRHCLLRTTRGEASLRFWALCARKMGELWTYWR